MIGSHDELTDAELLGRISEGDTGAPLEILYDRYERRLYGLGCKLLGDKGLAEELVQEVFLQLWRKAGRFDADRGSASAFIFAIARNKAIDLSRRPSSRPIDQVDPAITVDDLVNRLVSALTMREALDKLGEKHRAIVEAIYGRGERAVDVAEQLNIPQATVRSRAFHGLRALGEILQHLGYEPST
jgi:RNA polymerase sigma-70 factor, ECF subfamily